MASAHIFSRGRFKLVGRLVALLAAFAALGAPSQGAAQNLTVAASARLFPTAAAPGQTAWIVGAARLADEGFVWVGGQAARYSKDPVSGWLAFQVPNTAARGPQFIGLQGPVQRSPLILNVLPTESAAGLT